MVRNDFTFQAFGGLPQSAFVSGVFKLISSLVTFAALLLCAFGAAQLAAQDESRSGHDCSATGVAKDSISDDRDACKPAAALAYVANEFSDTVSVIDTDTNLVVATILVPAITVGPVRVAITPNAKRAYVTVLLSGTVAVIDTGYEKGSGYRHSGERTRVCRHHTGRKAGLRHE
jgi:YVTN family beta-propeller protein